jgi:nitrite reductase (NADH) large subunit
MDFRATQIFPNYTRFVKPQLSLVWAILRGITFCVFFLIIALLFINPTLGLTLFWGLIVPTVPALFVMAPGLWRQVCPFAMSNQTPRLLNFTKGYELPEKAQSWAYTISVILFIGLVALRKPLFNSSGEALGMMLLATCGLAFMGGLFFKGRSGWCGTFCPLGPIQRHYGQAPAINVPNGFCPTCVGCQKNCYDFNPKAAVFDNVYDENPQNAGQNRFFMALMPGLILGYFLQTTSTNSYPEYLIVLTGYTLSSVALSHIFTSFFGFNPYRVTAGFGAVALVLFYIFAGPIFTNAISNLLDIENSSIFTLIMQSLGGLFATILIYNGQENETLYEEGKQEAIKQHALSLAAGPKTKSFQIIDKTTGKTFNSKAGGSLLSAIHGNGLELKASCLSGLCGSDPVMILAGSEHISAPTDDEAKTLKRLGLPDNVRLACCCRINGNVTISREIVAKKPDNAVTSAQNINTIHAPSPHSGKKIIIIGNGISAITTAETLRDTDKNCQISMIAVEPDSFYNRMALGKIIDGSSVVDDIVMLQKSWYLDHRIITKFGHRAMSIDREQNTVTLTTGETLPYDKLVLATGARARVPVPMFLAHRNAFVLRSAGDAQTIVNYIRQTGAKTAAVLGGGVLGIEACEALRDFGLKVTIVHRGTHLMDRQLDNEGAYVLQRHLELRGIKVELGAKVTEYCGEGVYTHATTEDGRTIKADIWIASVGNQPNIELARNSGLNIRNGILVDENMRSSDDCVFAVGDVAEFKGEMPGLWSVGIAQATVASSTILGRQSVYKPLKQFISLKSSGVELISYGDVAAQKPGTEVITAPLFNASWWRFNVQNSQVQSAVYVGPYKSGADVKRLLMSRTPIDDILPDLRLGSLDVLAQRH